MYKDISKETKKVYKITSPGTQVFFLGGRGGEITFSLEKAGAEIEIFGLFEGSGKQKCKLSIIQRHVAPQTKSNVTIKSVLNGSSQFSFEGLIHIEKKAHGTEAHLTNRNLILSKRAHVETKPLLEILPDDVVCTHAATTGRLDQNQLHFLHTRGCTKKQAEDLLVSGFAQSLFLEMERSRS